MQCFAASNHSSGPALGFRCAGPGSRAADVLSKFVTFELDAPFESGAVAAVDGVDAVDVDDVDVDVAVDGGDDDDNICEGF